MWTAVRIAAGFLVMALYGWLLSRGRPALPAAPTRWQRLLHSGLLTLAVALGMPLAGLTLIFGTGVWTLLIAGWIYVLGGGVLGITVALVWERISKRMPTDRRDLIGRLLFWTFFAGGGLGLLLLSWRLWMAA